MELPKWMRLQTLEQAKERINDMTKKPLLILVVKINVKTSKENSNRSLYDLVDQYRKSQ